MITHHLEPRLNMAVKILNPGTAYERMTGQLRIWANNNRLFDCVNRRIYRNAPMTYLTSLHSQ